MRSTPELRRQRAALCHRFSGGARRINLAVALYAGQYKKTNDEARLGGSMTTDQSDERDVDCNSASLKRTERDARLVTALRRNLPKRKDQQRARTTAGDTGDSI